MTRYIILIFSAVRRFVLGDVLCCGVFCAMGLFCAVGRLEMGCFESRTFCAVGRLVLWDV